MNRLHEGLSAAGFNSGDEDIEAWEYGEGTREAVCAFQASVSLPETGRF